MHELGNNSGTVMFDVVDNQQNFNYAVSARHAVQKKDEYISG